MLASWFYQSLPLFSFVLHSFLPYCVDDNLRYAHYSFGVRLEQEQCKPGGGSYIILTNNYKEKLVILLSIGIIVIKNKETRVITYTCRYSRGHLIPIIQLCQDELGIKCPLAVHKITVGHWPFSDQF